jgi:hypothetical protein
MEEERGFVNVSSTPSRRDHLESGQHGILWAREKMVAHGFQIPEQRQEIHVPANTRGLKPPCYPTNNAKQWFEWLVPDPAVSVRSRLRLR